MVLNTAKSSRPQPFVLSSQLFGQTEINRLLRELERINESLVGHEASMQLPKISNLLTETSNLNGYKLTDSFHRQHISEQLTKIHDHAPIVHVSFATEPPPKVTETVLQWLRNNVHRYALLQIGLQPAIAAGCVLRTSNKIFDMSLGARLRKEKPYLLELIKTVVDGPNQPATPSGVNNGNRS